MSVYDYKKAQRSLYQPTEVPMIIDVPEMLFIQIDGKGDPSETGGDYTKAVELLYSVSYAIKMMPKSGSIPPGYYEYVVPPLEGLWGLSHYEKEFDYANKSELVWTSMIRQPEFVTDEVFQQACTAVQKKKKLDCSMMRLVKYTEGLSVQCMHIGPFKDEPETVEKMKEFVHESGYMIDLSEERKHHEIYLSDPRKIDEKKMKTVLRYPIK